MGPDELNDIILILFGVCIWDYLTSLWFECKLLTKKIRFRWQFASAFPVPYFLARYFNLAHITLNAVTFLIGYTTLPLCTRAFGISSLFLGDMAMSFSTWNLLVRTMIVWGHHPPVVKSLLAIGFLHFALSIVVSSIGRAFCTQLPPSTLGVLIFGTTTTIIELAILVLSLVGIRRASRHKESHLARLLKTQGIVYFVMVASLHVATMIASFAPTEDGRHYIGMWVGTLGSTLGPLLSCRLVTSTLSQDFHADSDTEARTHRIERFELPEDQTQDPSSTRMSTCILEVTKDQTVY